MIVARLQHIELVSGCEGRPRCGCVGGWRDEEGRGRWETSSCFPPMQANPSVCSPPSIRSNWPGCCSFFLYVSSLVRPSFSESGQEEISSQTRLSSCSSLYLLVFGRMMQSDNESLHIISDTQEPQMHFERPLDVSPNICAVAVIGGNTPSPRRRLITSHRFTDGRRTAAHAMEGSRQACRAYPRRL